MPSPCGSGNNRAEVARILQKRWRYMTDDQVTIFLPLTHYHPEYLRQALASVFGQTRADWRLLIVVNREDEGHFRGLLAEPLADARVRLVHNEGRLLAGSYNSAMRAAETEFVTVLLGDDLLAAEATAVLGEQIRAHPRTDFFHSGRYFIDAENQRISSDYLLSLPVTREGFIHGSPVKHLFCWRAALGLVGGGVDESLDNHGSDDFDFPWLMLERGAVFTPIPQCLYIVRDHRESYRLTTHLPRSRQLRALRHILEKHGVEPRLVRRRLQRAKRDYLRQALFRNGLERWLRERFGFDARGGWRESYR